MLPLRVRDFDKMFSQDRNTIQSSQHKSNNSKKDILKELFFAWPWFGLVWLISSVFYELVFLIEWSEKMKYIFYKVCRLIEK